MVRKSPFIARNKKDTFAPDQNPRASLFHLPRSDFVPSWTLKSMFQPAEARASDGRIMYRGMTPVRHSKRLVTLSGAGGRKTFYRRAV
jgi:hypothetical protein